MKTSIFFNQKTFQFVTADQSDQKKDYKVIITHDQILEILPEIVKTDSVADSAKDVVIVAVKKLVEELMKIEFPMVGFGRINLNPENTVLIYSQDLIDKLLTPISEIDFSVRVFNSLKAAEFKYFYELLIPKEADFLHFRNFGSRSLKELVEIFEINKIDNQVILLLRNKDQKLKDKRFGSISEFSDNEIYKNVLEFLDVLPGKRLCEVGRLFHYLFPYRGDRQPPFENETEYEKKFPDPKDPKRNEIKANFNDLSSLVDDFYQRKMIEFIKNL